MCGHRQTLSTRKFHSYSNCSHPSFPAVLCLVSQCYLLHVPLISRKASAFTRANVFDSAPAPCGSAQDSAAMAGKVAGGPDSFYGGEDSFVE